MAGSGVPVPDPPDRRSGAVPPAAVPADWEREFFLRWGDPDAPLPADPRAGCPEPGRLPLDDEDPLGWISTSDFDPEDLADEADLAGHAWLPEDPCPDPEGARGAGQEDTPLQLLSVLAAAEPGRLDYSQTVHYLAAVRRAGAWLESCTAKLEHRLLQTAVDGQQAVLHPGTPERARAGARELAELSAAAELACLLRLSEGAARARLAEARELCTIFPATLAALAEGRLTRAQAAVILDQSAALPQDVRGNLEAALLPDAAGLSVPGLRRKARRLRDRLHPALLAERRSRAEAGRSVELVPGDDGMALLRAWLPAETAAAIWHRLTGAARGLQGPDEQRTLAQLRTDVLADLLTSAGMDTGPAAGIRAEVMVTVPAFTLLGLDEQPAELDGYGPVPAAVARRLCGRAGSFRRLLTHPETGIRLSYGTTVYRVPADLARAVRHRNPQCTFAGCTRSARQCDLDHTRDFAAGGATSLDNLGPACRMHHRLKHTTGWTPVQRPGGIFTWTSPAGLTYTTVPDHLADGPPHYPHAILKHLPEAHRKRLLQAAAELRRTATQRPAGTAQAGGARSGTTGAAGAAPHGAPGAAPHGTAGAQLPPDDTPPPF